MHSDHAERLPEPASELAEGGAGEGVTLPPQEALLDDTGTGEATVDLAPPRHRLPQIALPDNVVLKGAVQKLVEQKSRLDALAADGQLAGLLPREWQGHGVRAIELSTFIQGVLPFLQPGERGETAPARLPVRHVLGDDSRWGLEDVAEPKSLAWYLAATNAPPLAARTWPRPIWWVRWDWRGCRKGAAAPASCARWGRTAWPRG